MIYLTATGVCLAALVGSAWYETRRMKREEELIKKALRSLADGSEISL
jgi:hypothetical protein